MVKPILEQKMGIRLKGMFIDMINEEKFRPFSSGDFSFYAPMKIRRRLIALLAFALCAFVLVGCSQQAVDTADAPDAEAGAPTGASQGSGNEAPQGSSNEAARQGGVAPVVEEEVTEDNIFEFVILGQFTGMEYSPASVLPVTDDEVEAWISEHLSQALEVVPVTGRAVMVGDIVNIDFEGFLDGVAFEGGTAQGFDLTIGSGRFIPGFEEQIIGHNIGDEFDIHVEFPADYIPSDLAGAAVVFRIKLHSISAEEVPELTDELVQEHLDMASVEEYRARIRAQMESDRELNARNSERMQVWTQILDNATILKLPADEVEFRVEQAMFEFTWYAMMYGIELEELVSQVTGLTLDEFIDMEIRPGAISDVGNDLVLRAIAAQEGFVLSEDEFNEAVAGYLEEFGFEDEESFFEAYGERAVRIALLAEQVIEFIMENSVTR